MTATMIRALKPFVSSGPRGMRRTFSGSDASRGDCRLLVSLEVGASWRVSSLRRTHGLHGADAAWTWGRKRRMGVGESGGVTRGRIGMYLRGRGDELGVFWYLRRRGELLYIL